MKEKDKDREIKQLKAKIKDMQEGFEKGSEK